MFYLKAKTPFIFLYFNIIICQTKWWGIISSSGKLTGATMNKMFEFELEVEL
jgi:hypothetical protein